ncbi:SusD/RagB family nutrient-binding outer membrane lipoprotein, partial [Alistipes sp. An54]|uniref:SusD/RagB family nutrient-binding outer membrane lipoprotein n=1 Tax=Alistipes sp. An54 TaxID=1965645 RepID=UPI000B390C15
KMFEELDEAIATLGRNTTLSSDAWSRYDGVYYGNIAQWLKYANSLKLRMAMRLTEVKPELAKTKASEAIAGGVITSNADNAAMHAAENRTTLIYNDWGDHRVGADILCYMNGYKDPRVEKMFLPNDVGNYVGIRIGIDVAGKSTAMTKYSNLIVESTTPYLWFNAAEATFLRAEYELRWGSEETAQSLYEQAIRLSFEERGASGADAYVADATSRPAAYTDPLGNYSAAAQSTITIAWTPGPENFEANLERIITQKWIAIFPLGVEAWSEHRRTGYPRLLPVVADKSGGGVDVAQGARRLPYPVEEYQQNNTNLQAAIQQLNAEQTNGNRTGDQMGTRVWWDCKPYNN